MLLLTHNLFVKAKVSFSSLLFSNCFAQEYFVVSLLEHYGVCTVYDSFVFGAVIMICIYFFCVLKKVNNQLAFLINLHVIHLAWLLHDNVTQY